MSLLPQPLAAATSSSSISGEDIPKPLRGDFKLRSQAASRCSGVPAQLIAQLSPPLGLWPTAPSSSCSVVLGGAQLQVSCVQRRGDGDSVFCGEGAGGAAAPRSWGTCGPCPLTAGVAGLETTFRAKRGALLRRALG